jgi:hypothetical protein
MTQYFYRTSHRERFNSLQFGKTFIGFTEYNYYLHALLIILNTYSAHIIVLFLTPISFEPTEQATDDDTAGKNKKELKETIDI